MCKVERCCLVFGDSGLIIAGSLCVRLFNWPELLHVVFTYKKPKTVLTDSSLSCESQPRLRVREISRSSACPRGHFYLDALQCDHGGIAWRCIPRARRTRLPVPLDNRSALTKIPWFYIWVNYSSSWAVKRQRRSRSPRLRCLHITSEVGQ